MNLFLKTLIYPDFWGVAAGVAPCEAHLEIEDEPRGRALTDDIDKEVGDGKQPDIGASQHVTGQGLDHGWLLLVCTQSMAGLFSREAVTITELVV